MKQEKESSIGVRKHTESPPRSLPCPPEVRGVGGARAPAHADVVAAGEGTHGLGWFQGRDPSQPTESLARSHEEPVADSV